ncbi:discs large homolog 1-like protein isoform X1 [Acropora millepora]|uniref:discs large homolog 1-like protein isoform X1 n=1 Tax=Acropora millepora TaxID=45264 RepID=UPI0010FCB890|nr:discs large homolog 1-like protein isoform X1 [Acropora millepora]
MDGYNSDNERKKLWDELSSGIKPSRIVVVHLTKGDGGFGFNIRGGLDHPHVGSDPGIFITTVKADSVAGRDGRLEPGDRILALNDIRLDCVTHDVAVNEFRKADESVSLLVEKNAETYLLSCSSASQDNSFVDGPTRLDSAEEEEAPFSSNLVTQFYESKLGALSIGLAVGSLAVFIFLKMYRATKS